jgi:hypothetical protein
MLYDISSNELPKRSARTSDREIELRHPITMRSKRFIHALVFAAAATLAAIPATAQTRPGPLPPPANAPPPTVIPTESKPEPPSVPVQEIIKRFSENEDAMLHAHGAYTYKKVVRVEELDDDGKPAGTFQFTTELTQLPDGRFYERELKHPETSLNVLNLEPEALAPLLKIPPLPFITTQLGRYDLHYIGTQKLDELNTYIFQVEPKQVERQRAYFKGVIWVDDQDFVIVKTLGHWVTELGEISTDNFPFKFFDTYRENVAGKIWFPSYLRSDDSVNTKHGLVHVRLIVRWEDYKPRVAAPAPAQQP